MSSQKFGVQMPGRHHVPLAERSKLGQVVGKVEWEDEEIVSRHTVSDDAQAGSRNAALEPRGWWGLRK